MAATLTVMAASAKSATGPVCYVCRRDGIFDQTARHPAAAVRVGICGEPYVLNVCERHLALLQATLPTGGLWLIERYQRQPDGQLLQPIVCIQRPLRRRAIYGPEARSTDRYAVTLRRKAERLTSAFDEQHKRP